MALRLGGSLISGDNLTGWPVIVGYTFQAGGRRSGAERFLADGWLG